MTGTTIVFDPTAPDRIEGQRKRRILEGLKGKVVGFIDNSKPNFNHLVDDLAQLLEHRYGVKSTLKRSKRMPSVAASEEVMAELAARCDLVVTGAGD
jgi:hypothetical protein